MEVNLILEKLESDWWKWDSNKFATALTIANAWNLTYGAISKYEKTKGLNNYNADPTAPEQDHLYNLGDIIDIKKNLGIRKKKPLKLRVEKV